MIITLLIISRPTCSCTTASLHHCCWCTAQTHHIEEHDHAEVDADCRACSRHLRIVPDESPAKGGKGADSDHAVNDDAKHGGDHHQYLWRVTKIPLLQISTLHWPCTVNIFVYQVIYKTHKNGKCTLNTIGSQWVHKNMFSNDGGTHHEEYPRCWDDEATVFVSEGLVRLRLSRYGVHPLFLWVFGLELGAYFILQNNGHDTHEKNLTKKCRLLLAQQYRKTKQTPFCSEI